MTARCRTSSDGPGADLPLLALIERFRRGADDPVEWMVLTHPHEDHAAGFAEMVNAVEPHHIGVAGLDGSAPSLIDMVTARALPTTLGEVHTREAVSACQAMRSWEVRHGRAVARLRDGSTLCDHPVAVQARAPDATAMAALLGQGWERLRGRANSLSVVVELTWGNARLVLGGDLPVQPALGTGWNTVLEAHPHLPGASAIKIPHHASRAALHDSLLARHQPSACWWVTPYSRSGLPRTGPDGGLTHLLTLHTAVSLTSLPHSQAQKQMPDPPGSMDLGSYEAAAAMRAATGFVADASVLTPARHTALGPVWGAAFDVEGNVRGAWRGPAAFTVTPRPQPPP